MKKHHLLPCLPVALSLLCVILSCGNSTAPSDVKYTVIFQTGPGATVIENEEVPEGTTLELELSKYQPERSGHYFEGWYIQGDTAQTIITEITVNGNYRLVAKWANSVSVTLDTQGGTLQGDPGANIRPGDTFEASWYTPSKPGYIFKYWYKEGDASKKEVESIVVRSNITLVALWEEGWIVTINLDGGEYYGGNSITVAKGATLDITTIKPVTKDGYVREGWYYEAAFSNSVPAEITVTSNITLYIKWAPLTDYEPYFKVWTGATGTYWLYYDQDADGLTGFYLSTAVIRSFTWNASSIDGKTSSLASGTLTVGTDTFTAATTMTVAGDPSLSKMWEKDEGDDKVSFLLFDNGNGMLFANNRLINISYAVNDGKLYLLRQNNDENDNPLAGEVLLAIPIVDGIPSGYEEGEFGEGGGGVF